MKEVKCTVCGYVYEGETLPEDFKYTQYAKHLHQSL